MELVNNGARALQLTTLRAAVRDHEGRIVQRLELNGNGGLPGITTIADRTWNPGEAQTIFNPFHTLAPDIPLGRIDMEFVFNAGGDTTLTERLEVRPQPYVQRTALVMPMPGRVLVWDGHDFYSHHRRWDFSPPTMKRLGIVTNPGRYSLDLVVVDQDGLFHSGEGDTRDQHFSYGALIIAPGDGTVVAMANDASNEPSEPTMESFLSDPMLAIYGNYVVIDHGNGEFSQLGHLKQGSVRIRVGDRVRQGQPIAQAGASGTSLFPHLHYQLTNAPGIHAEGLPPRFSELYRVLGSSRNLETDAWIDSGDIIESRP
ncbi:MAG TPA: M23 family metallopeptidase [Allosphingosinicella sp.]|nr:M23 family metallopeptidase [Allosphingosinicella sp.]